MKLGTSILVAMLALAAPAGAQQAVTLPGGASALNETHGNWIVHCEVIQQKIGCVLQQEQTNSTSRQRILAIELAPADGVLRGTLVLPFGLALDSGVTLQIDTGTPIAGLRFRTCLPAGCLVDLAFESPILAAMATGSVLKVIATADNGTEAPFSIPLTGFSSALDRTLELLR